MPTATVHAWNDTSWRHDGAHARLIAFDLDNTLAVSKQPMKPDMTVRIEALTELMPAAGVNWSSVRCSTCWVPELTFPTCM